MELPRVATGMLHYSESLKYGGIDLEMNPAILHFRLPSLRGPRDLTLGGPTKRTFTPNIPVRRGKPKTEFNE